MIKLKKKTIALAVVLVGLAVFLSVTNFEHDGSLANFQDESFAKYNSGEKMTEQELHRLESNKWVALARFLAPNNMVVRQYCLIDLYRGEKGNEKRIVELIDEIAPEGVWLEGYSYWLYTKPFLEKYDERFQAAEIRRAINAIDANFVMTAYRREGKLYPAPFGDLRDVPLEDSLQSGQPSDKISVGIVTKEGDAYSIKSAPLGFNMHTPERGTEVQIVDGRPKGFVFYEGYDKKYKTPFHELLDMLDIGRVLYFLQD